MTMLAFFAAVGMPLIIVILAFAVLKLFQWDLKRHDRLHPGE
jgi:hypothetical protein